MADALAPVRSPALPDVSAAEPVVPAVVPLAVPAVEPLVLPAVVPLDVPAPVPAVAPACIDAPPLADSTFNCWRMLSIA